MNMRITTGKRLLSLLLPLILSHLAATAQPKVFFEDQIVEPGTTFKASIKVKDFTDILGLQFSVKWDPQVLRFTDVSDFAFDYNINENFGFNYALSEGRIAFIYVDPGLDVFSLPDSTVLFAIDLEAIGEVHDTTSMRFWDQAPLPAPEMYNGNSQTIPDAGFDFGMVTLDVETATSLNSVPEKAALIESYPNPFTDQITFVLSLGEAADAGIQIRNVQGQLVYAADKRLNAGRNQLVFTKQLFGQAGVYTCQIKGADFTLSKKVILVDR